MRGRPKAKDQKVARAVLARAIKQRRFSLRGLAKRIGLKGHGAVSRFLSGQQNLSQEHVVRLAREVGIEGRELQRVLRSLLPEGVASLLETNELQRREDAVDRELVQGDDARLSDERFFYHPKAPIVYETLKIIGPSTTRELHDSLHDNLGLSRDDVATCLRSLADLGLVRVVSVRWHVVDASKDMVVPTKWSSVVAKNTVVDTLATQRRFVELTGDSRLMRSIVLSVKTPPSGRTLEALLPHVLKLQDDCLAAQTVDDDAVVQILIGCIKVAGAKGGKSRRSESVP